MEAELRQILTTLGEALDHKEVRTLLCTLAFSLFLPSVLLFRLLAISPSHTPPSPPSSVFTGCPSDNGQMDFILRDLEVDSLGMISYDALVDKLVS